MAFLPSTFCCVTSMLWCPRAGIGAVSSCLWYWWTIFNCKEDWFTERWQISGVGWLARSPLRRSSQVSSLENLNVQSSPNKRVFLRKPMDSSLYWCSQCSQCLQTQGSSSKTREKRGRCQGCGGLIGNRRDEVEKKAHSKLWNYVCLFRFSICLAFRHSFFGFEEGLKK